MHPDDFQIFEQRVPVAGLHYRKGTVLKFANCKKPYLVFERELDNQYDPNAIKIIGLDKVLFNIKIGLLGYVPRDLAKQIVESGYYSRVFPRISYFPAPKDKYLDLYFDLLGPKGEKDAFHKKLPPTPDATPIADGGLMYGPKWDVNVQAEW